MPNPANKHWLIRFILENDLGDIASVAGVIIALIGFIVTFINVARSKSAAERAERAALDAKEKVRKFDTIVEVSSALTTMGEIQRLHRAGTWPILPDRYAALRRHLIAIRGANPDLPDERKATIQGAITHLKAIEEKVEQALEAGRAPDGIATLNRVISEQADKLQEVLIALRGTGNE